MNFSTVTKSGVFQYIQKDSTKKIVVPEVEYQIVEVFNHRYEKNGIQLVKYSENLPLAFMLVAETRYNSESTDKRHHPDYSELVLCTGYLNSIADGFDLKCTRKGT